MTLMERNKLDDMLEIVGHLQRITERENPNDLGVREYAGTAGLRTYDTALPQRWTEGVYNYTNLWPQDFGFVWCYDEHDPKYEPFESSTIFGHPHPLTTAAVVLLAWAKSVGM